MSATGIQAQLENLQQQITALQQELAKAQSDSITPNYLSLNAQGQVIANFPGIQLPTDHIDGQTGPATSSFVRWLNASNGLVDGGVILERSDSASQNLATLQSKAEAAADTSQAWIQARDQNNGLQAAVFASQDGAGAHASVDMQIKGTQYKVMDETGLSTFARSGTGLTVGSNTAPSWSTTSSTPHLVQTGTINIVKKDAYVLFVLGFSGYTSTVGSVVSAGVGFNGLTPVTLTPKFYFNQANVHCNVGPWFALTAGPGTVPGSYTADMYLAAWSGQFTQDGSDQVSMLVMELP